MEKYQWKRKVKKIETWTRKKKNNYALWVPNSTKVITHTYHLQYDGN